MMKWLQAFFPQITIAKLIAYAVAAAAALALLVFAYLTIKGWRDDSLALPVVTQQRDDAVAAYNKLDSDMTGRLDGIAGKIGAIDVQRQGVDQQLASNQSAIGSDIAGFIRRFANAVPTDPACAEPQPVRDGMLALFPLYVPAQRGIVGSGGAGGRQAEPPDTADQPAAVPGQQRAESHQGDLGMSATAGSETGVGVSAAPGTSSEADRGAAGGDGSALPVESVGLARRWYDRASAAVVAAMKFVGHAAEQTAQDDRRDGR